MKPGALALLLALAAAIFSGSLAAEAQQAGKIYRLGILSPAVPPAGMQIGHAHTLEVLRELGYVEGQNSLARAVGRRGLTGAGRTADHRRGRTAPPSQPDWSQS